MPDGGYRSYTALMDRFIPDLTKQGVTKELMDLITVKNPVNAFAF
jgi:predicted metal-dependent phosphotriesterase family hydrolase